MVLDEFFGVVFITPPNALGELVSLSQILLALVFAPFGFTFRELLRLVRSYRSICFLVGRRFRALSSSSLPLPCIRFSFPGMSLSIGLVPH